MNTTYRHFFTDAEARAFIAGVERADNPLITARLDGKQGISHVVRVEEEDQDEHEKRIYAERAAAFRSVYGGQP